MLTCRTPIALPPRSASAPQTDAPLRVPISGAYKIKGVGDVLAGRVEQGIVKPGDEVIFLPTHTTANPCVGKVFTVEMHHKRVDKAGPGDNVGMNIKVRAARGRPEGGLPGRGCTQQASAGKRQLRVATSTRRPPAYCRHGLTDGDPCPCTLHRAWTRATCPAPAMS